MYLIYHDTNLFHDLNFLQIYAFFDKFPLKVYILKLYDFMPSLNMFVESRIFFICLCLAYLLLFKSSPIYAFNVKINKTVKF